MTNADKIILGSTLSLALACGFLPALFPSSAYEFNRLHIFLFNLCAGGSVLLYYASRGHTRAVSAYFLLALVYAVTAFLDRYWATLLVSVPLFALVERTRERRFSLVPWDFFRPGPSHEKFLHAALLCLSCGIAIASLVIVNSEYLHVVSLRKLTLDVFFLGFSFPVSLLTFSIIFSFTQLEGTPVNVVLRELSFWTINVGVILFFAFILFEAPLPELVIANTLLAAVALTYYLFWKSCPAVQQRSILASGMVFLVVTGVTGVLYLLGSLLPGLRGSRDFLLILHGTVSLYGWNLSGLLIVVRWDSYPIFKHVNALVVLHWLAVFLLTPLGKLFAPASILALLAYVALIGTFFFARSLKGGLSLDGLSVTPALAASAAAPTAGKEGGEP